MPLADYVRVLGADHPDTLTSRNNLAAAYESAGDLGRADSRHDQLLPAVSMSEVLCTTDVGVSR